MSQITLRGARSTAPKIYDTDEQWASHIPRFFLRVATQLLEGSGEDRGEK
jgi:hypothetical protein